MNVGADRKVPESRSEQTRAKLLAAGIDLFAREGFAATSTRQIETAAGVQRNLMSYHFGSKDAFWKACMDELFQQFIALVQPAIDQSRDIEPVERVRFVIRRFVRASAALPEVNRIMVDEGRRNDWRLEWIVRHYSRGFYEAIGRLYEEGQRQGILPDLPLINVYYFIVGGAAMFSMAPECALLAGKDPKAADMIDAQADALVRLLTGGR